MNKKTIYNALLIGLPVAAIGIAFGGKSITIIDRATDAYTYQSYFALLPESCFQWSTWIAMVLAVAAAVLAVIYVVSGSDKWLKGIYLSTFVSVFAAEIPTLMQNELIVLPNVLVPILLIADCVMAYSKMKKPQEEKKQQGQRLQAKR